MQWNHLSNEIITNFSKYEIYFKRHLTLPFCFGLVFQSTPMLTSRHLGIVNCFLLLIITSVPFQGWHPSLLSSPERWRRRIWSSWPRRPIKRFYFLLLQKLKKSHYKGLIFLSYKSSKGATEKVPFSSFVSVCLSISLFNNNIGIFSQNECWPKPRRRRNLTVL